MEFIGEVQYYFRVTIADEIKTCALISEYSAPHAELYKTSSHALAVSKYLGQDQLRVIFVKSILSVVAMIPYPHGRIGAGEWHFLVEKMGLTMFHFRGDEEVDEEEGENRGEGA